MHIYQQKNAVQRVEAAIHIVTEKKIVVERRFASNFKKFQQIEKLSVHCTPGESATHTHTRMKHKQEVKI